LKVEIAGKAKKSKGPQSND